MKKLLYTVLIMVFALTAVFSVSAETTPDVSNSGTLRLEPVSWSDASYSILSRHMISVTEEWLQEQGVTMEDAEELGDVGLITDNTSVEIADTEDLLSEARLLSVSPDGRTLLAEISGVAVLIREKDNELQVVSLDLTRCEPSEREGYRDAVALCNGTGLGREGVGKCGVIWSPDSRYALITNASVMYMTMRNIYGLTWIDVQNGFIYMAKPGGKINPVRSENAGTMVSQCCAADNAVYATVYDRSDGDTGMQLRRYEPGTDTFTVLCKIPGVMSCEGMGMNAEGKLVCLLSERELPDLAICSPEDGSYTKESLPRWFTHPAYLSVTPGCTMLSILTPNEDMYPMQAILTDETWNKLIVDEGAAAARLDPISPDTIPAPEGLTILQASLSSDGTKALLCCKNQNDDYSFYCMNTADYSLTPVDLTAIEDVLSEKILTPGYNNNGYLPGICFTGGDHYVILPFEKGQTMLCALAE